MVDWQDPVATLGRRREPPGVVDLVYRLLAEVSHLLDQKLALLQAELRAQIGAAIQAVVLVAVGGVVGALGVFLLLVALAVWVGELVGTAPGGYAIVGGVIAGAGAIALVVGRRRLARQRLVPAATMQELRRDVEWIKNET